MIDQNSQFYAILTNVGAAKQANADALGIPWVLTHMGIGDANPTGLESPALPMPDGSWTSLLNEWRRAPLNQLKVDDKDSAIVIAEQVIPAEVGGRWIREIALYDADGDLVAVANCPPTYKPMLSQGSGRTQVVRMNLVVSSSSNIQLKIDPSVVLATREFVAEELAKQDFKHSVLVATTGPIVLSGQQTIDGIALTAGVRVLVKHQAAAKDNGLYVVAPGAWTRCTDANTSAKVTPGLLVLVEKGTLNGDSAWQLVTDGPISLGVSALAFEMAFGRTGVAEGTYRSVTVDKYGRVVGATNPTTVAGYGLTDVYTKTQIDQALLLKANLLSPALTGTPTTPTPAAGSSSKQVANAEFVRAEIAALVGSAPAALDTLNELSSALGGDANFATTVTNALAGKVALSDKATQQDAETGTNDTKWMTSLRVFQAIAKVVKQATETSFGWAKLATQQDAETGTDNTKIMPPLRVAQLALKMLNSWGIGTDNPPAITTFNGNTKTGFYVGYGATANNATPGCPPGSATNVLGVVAINARNDITYYYVFENGASAATRRYWVGQWNDNIGTVFWSRLMSFDQIATQVQVDEGVDDATIVTPKKMRWGWAASFTQNGYILFPTWLGSFLIQWVSVSTTTTATAAFTWPLAFSSFVRTVGIAHSSAPTIGNLNGVTPNGGNADTYNSSAARVVGNVQVIGVGK